MGLWVQWTRLCTLNDFEVNTSSSPKSRAVHNLTTSVAALLLGAIGFQSFHLGVGRGGETFFGN